MRGAAAAIVDFRAPNGQVVSLTVTGTSTAPALLASVTELTLLGVAENNYFHCTPDILDEVRSTASSDRPSTRSTLLVLLGGPGLAAPANLDAAAAAQWLLDDPSRTEADQWFLATWERAGQIHRTVWDYLHPAAANHDAAQALSTALQFVLDRQPDMPIDLVEANRLLTSMTADTNQDPLSELAGVLDAMEVRSDLLSEDGPLGFSMGGEIAEWDCLAEVVDSTWMVLYAMLPLVISEDRLADAPRLAGRINARLPIGCLLIEEDTGTVMYRAAIDLGGPAGHTSLIRRLLDQVHGDVEACLAMLDQEIAADSVVHPA